MRIRITQCPDSSKWYASYIGSEFTIDESYHVLADPPKQTEAGEIVAIIKGRPYAILREDVEILPERVDDTLEVVRMYCPYCRQFLFTYEGKEIPQRGQQVNLNDLHDGDYPAPRFGDKMGCPACGKGKEDPYEGLAWLSALYYCNFGTVREVKQKKEKLRLVRGKKGN